jgi:mono/diheme cytochrome c family protein
MQLCKWEGSRICPFFCFEKPRPLEQRRDAMRILRRSVVLAFVLVIALNAEQSAKADKSRGKVLAQQRCSQCHGINRGEKSPYLAVPSFTDVANEPSLTEYTLRVFLKTPHSTMPNLIINPNEMDDIVSYIASLKRKH